VRKPGYLKYKYGPVEQKEKEGYEASRIKAIEASSGMTNEQWLKNQERLQNKA
jgi:hypothetical protein